MTTLNKSLNQFKKECENARNQALKNPYKEERSDTVKLGSITGLKNTLIDIVLSKRHGHQDSTQRIDPVMKNRIESLFIKFPDQYRILGLYYRAGRTRTEIAKRLGLKRQNVGLTLQRAKTRLKKHLTPAEYDSIRWAIGETKKLQATPMPNDMRRRIEDYKLMRKSLEAGLPHVLIKFKEREYEGDKSKYINFQSKPITDPILGLHPPEKNLPIPRWEV